MKELDFLRLKINEIDSKIISLYEDRLDICQKISLIKKEQNLPIFNKEREEKIKEINYSLIRDFHHLISYQFFFENILFLSKEYQTLNNLPDLYKEIIITCKELNLKKIIAKDKISLFINDKLKTFNIKIEESIEPKNNTLSFWIDESSITSIFFSYVIENNVLFSIAFNIDNNDLYYTINNTLFHNYYPCEFIENKHQSAISFNLFKKLLSTSLVDLNELIKRFDFSSYLNFFTALSLLQKGLINVYLTDNFEYLINLLAPLNFQTKTIEYNQDTIYLIYKNCN